MQYYQWDKKVQRLYRNSPESNLLTNEERHGGFGWSPATEALTLYYLHEETNFYTIA